MQTTLLILYYDGLCPLCSREIVYYRKRVGSAAVSFVDITDPSFDAATHGLDARRIHRTMHARRGGRVYAGLDAFIALWEAVPGYAWLARLARVPALNEMMRVGYGLFALFRPLLPRLHRDNCDTGVCRR